MAAIDLRPSSSPELLREWLLAQLKKNTWRPNQRKHDAIHLADIEAFIGRLTFPLPEQNDV